MRTRGWSPPPENSSPTVAAPGATVPSARLVRSVSIVFQAPSTRVRTGRRCSRASSFPSGVAYTSLLSPRSDTISTFLPVRLALASASASDNTSVSVPCSDVCGGFAAGAAVLAADGSATTRPRPSATDSAPLTARLRDVFSVRTHLTPLYENLMSNQVAGL